MQKPKNKWTGVALILLLAVVTFSGCVGQEEEPVETVTVTTTKGAETITATQTITTTVGESKLPEVIKIGTVLPLTGTLGWLGPDMLRGAQIAAHDINRNGGIMGSQIEVLVGDSETTPEGALEAATSLVDIDKVQAIIGAAGSSNTLAIARGLTIDANVILISPASTSNEITEVDDNDTLWRTVGRDDAQGKAQAALVDHIGWETCAQFVMDNSYGVGLANDFDNAWDGEILGRAEYDDTVLAYQTELTALAALNPDFLWVVCYATDGAEIMKELNELGIDIPVLSADGLGDLNVVIDDDVASRLSSPPTIGTKPATADTAGYKKFAKLWKDSHASEAAIAEWGLYDGAEVDDPEGIYAQQDYDALNMLAMAIAFAGEYTADAIKEWLPQVSTVYSGASGDLTFNEWGEPAQEYSIYMFAGETKATAALEIIGKHGADGLTLSKEPYM